MMATNRAVVNADSGPTGIRRPVHISGEGITSLVSAADPMHFAAISDLTYMPPMLRRKRL